MSICEWIYNILIEGLKYIIIGYFFFGYEFSRKKSRYWLVLYPLLIPLAEWIGNENILYVYKNLWYLFVLFALFKGGIVEKIKGFVAMWFLVSVVDTIIVAIFSKLVLSKEESFTTVIIGCIGFVVWLTLAFKANKMQELMQKFWKDLSIREYISFIMVLLVLSFVMGGVQGYFYGAITVLERKVIFVIALVAILLFVCVCILLFWTRRSREQLKELNRVGLRYLELQRKYYEESLRQYEDMRKFRHDINHHILIMSELSAGNKIEELKEYIKKMTENCEIGSGIHTGNFIADCIIGYAVKDLQGDDFLFEIDGYFPEPFLMEDMDFCILLSNLFENAKEALEKIEGKRLLRLEIKRYKQWQYIVLCNNTIDEKIDFASTSKKEKLYHGYGTQNIRSVVEKYGGEVTWKQEGRFVEVNIKFRSDYGNK